MGVNEYLEVGADITFQNLRIEGALLLSVPSSLSPALRTTISAIGALTGYDVVSLTNIYRITQDAVEVARILVTSSSDPDSLRELAGKLIHMGVCLSVPIAADVAGSCIAWLEGSEDDGAALEMGMARFE
jgi:hypothetical protein